MKRWIAAFSLISIFGVAGFAAPKGPEVDLVDNRLSINAEGVSIGRLLQLVDMATGMKSKVPPELANRNISVKFAGLALNDAFRKMFQGQPLDYVVVAGRGIIVTAPSQTSPGTDSAPFTPQPSIQPTEQPFVQDFPPAAPIAPIQQQPQQQQPPMVQTPFGAIPNPRAAQQPNTPLNTPGQQNSLFPGNTNQPFGQPGQQQQVAPNGLQNSLQGGFSTPFGTPNQPVNNPNNQNNNNGLFGAPQVFGQQQQR
jgi:hypothetical protein